MSAAIEADVNDTAEPAARAPTLHRPTIVAMLLEVAVEVATIVLTLTHWHVWTVIPAMCLIATRQHALFILYHDAVHYNVARSRRLNDLVINALVGLPQLVPVHLYRRLHLAHHARLGSDADPERLLLYRDQPWNYRPLRLRTLAAQVLGDVLLLNNFRTLFHFGREVRDPRSKLQLPKARTYPELWLFGLAYAGAFAAWAVADATTALRFVLLWVVPLFTLTHALQKVRSFVEHAAMDAPERSYSWRPGWLGRCLIWPYHINYHREHHIQPRVPWYRLPAAFPDARQRPGRTLWRVLWNGRW